MSCLISTAATLCIDDIVALSDSELAQLLEKHRRPDGGFELPVDSWDKLTKEERSHLAGRLQKAQGLLAQNPAACSHPLDLDKVNALLAEVSDNRTTTSRTESYDELADLRDVETEAYRDLVNDGGRPLYPISLLEQVLEDPQEYREMLWPFWEISTVQSTPWLVYQKQLDRWQSFRNWQKDNRGLEVDVIDFPAYVEMMKRLHIKQGLTQEVRKTEADPERHRLGWELYVRPRQWQRRWQREPDCDGFSDYVDAMKRRLARHGFTRPFQLHEDPKQQDQSTTWIEYLGFEYWWLDWHAKSIEQLKPDHDKRWQELVDLKVLKPHETKDFIRTDDSSREQAKEEDQAWAAKQAAEAEAERVYTLTQEDPDCLSIPAKKRVQMLQAATEELVAAKEKFRAAKRRGGLIVGFVRATFDHEDAKKSAAHHAVLLQWILEQLPLIEAQLQPKRTEVKSNATGSHGQASQLSGGSVAAPTRAPLAIPDDRPRSRDEMQGSPTSESSARRPLGSMEHRRGVELGDGVEQNTQKPKRLGEDASTKGQKSAAAADADHQRQAGKPRQGDTSLADGTPVMPARDDNAATQPSVAAGIQDAQIANVGMEGGRQQRLPGSLGETKRHLTDEDDLGRRGSKERKLRYREPSSASGGSPIPAEAGEKTLTHTDSAMDQNEARGSGAASAPAGPRRSARIAARNATNPAGSGTTTAPAGPRRSSRTPTARKSTKPVESTATSLSAHGRSSRGTAAFKDSGAVKGKRRSRRRTGA